MKPFVKKIPINVIVKNKILHMFLFILINPKTIKIESVAVIDHITELSLTNE